MYVTTSRGQTASSDMLVFFDDVQLTTSDGLMSEHDGMDFTDDCSSATHTIQYINTGVDLAGVYTGVISYRVEVSPSY